MNNYIKSASIAFVFLILGFAGKSQQTAEIYSPGNKAINGYDPVAFFSEAKPVEGTAGFMYSWKGADWYFASQKNLDSFKLAPEKYAPQYGGYCAYGTADGHKAPTKPETWTIVDGKLYFNYNNKVKEMWTKDRPGFIKKADENWPKVRLQ